MSAVKERKRKCTLSEVDREFFKYFEPKLFDNELFEIPDYDDCDKVSVYILNKVLKQADNKDFVINTYLGRGSHSYVNKKYVHISTFW